jgi:hypothetical protein
MIATLMALLCTLRATVRSRLDLQADVLALRHQLGVLQRQAPHRRAFALAWHRKSRARRPGRPAVGGDLRALIRQMHAANPLWGAPRIHAELQTLGLAIAQFGRQAKQDAVAVLDRFSKAKKSPENGEETATAPEAGENSSQQPVTVN